MCYGSYRTLDRSSPWKPVWIQSIHSNRHCDQFSQTHQIDDKRSKTVARKFAQCWPTRYPWPQHCIHDPGTEFIGPEFQTLLQNCHIRDVCTTAKNSQSYAVCERMNQTIGNILRTYCQIHRDTLPNTWGHIAKHMGTRCQHKIYVQHIWGQIANTKEYMEYHWLPCSTLGSSPGNLVFNRDMFLNIPLIADWQAITQRREHLIHENLMRENQKRRGYDYAPRQLVLKTNGSLKNWAKEQVVRTKLYKSM